MTVLLDDGVDDELCRSGRVVVGEPDQTLVLGLEEIGEILGGLEAESLEGVGVVHESEDTGVDAVPEVVLVLVDVLCDVRCVLCIISLEQTLRSEHVVRICRAAEEDVCRRVALLFLDLGLDLTCRKALVCCLDYEELLEILADCGKILFLT